MPQSLTGLDAAFLYLETDDTPLHVAQTCVFDPSTGSGSSPFEELRALIERRLDRIPPFHQSLVGAPAGLGRPVWADDPDFDLDYHFQPAALPAPAGIEELARYTADFLETPLDHDRPLWEMRMIEDLEDGMIAGVTKVHHSCIDGVSGAELTANLLDLQPEPGTEPPAATRPTEGPPSSWELARRAAAAWLGLPLTVTSALAQAGTAAGRVWRLNRASTVPPPPPPFSAPVTPFNTRVRRERRVAFAQLRLDDVISVRKAFDATINDVVLAVCAGALRVYLDEHDVRPTKDLVAAVPVSVRTDTARASMGNQLSGMLVTLATTIDDPADRLAIIAEGARRAKDQTQAIGAGTIAALAELLPPIVGPRLGKLVARLRPLERPRPVFNVMISNFPGPPCPLYCAGAKLVAAYPLGPLISGAGLNITVQSYLDTLFVGLVGDARAIPDLDRLPGLLHQALDELTKLAGANPNRSVGR